MAPFLGEGMKGMLRGIDFLGVGGLAGRADYLDASVWINVEKVDIFHGIR